MKSKSVASTDDLTTPLPLLHLPYATYRAFEYDSYDDIYTFKNIRFAAPSTGHNRFSPPQRPKKMTKIQDGSVGWKCPQAVPIMFLVARPGLHGLEQSEDCLFLDITVPGHVVRSKDFKENKLAVVHWLTGGGFGISRSEWTRR